MREASRDEAARSDRAVRILGPLGVSVGPVFVSIQRGRCEHRAGARVADRAPYQ